MFGRSIALKMNMSHHNSTNHFYPMGAYGYIETNFDNLETMRAHLAYIWIQLIIHIIISYVQVRNINIALRLVIEQPRALVRWCCLVPSALCISITIFTIIFDLSNVFYLDAPALYSGWAIPICIMCYNIILLQKAYMVSHKSCWVLVIGIILIIVEVAIPVVMLNATVIANIDLFRRGFFAYPKTLIAMWFCASLVVNLFLSSIFSYMAYRQYRIFGSKTWKHLANDGTRSMCLVIFFNTICAIIMFFCNILDIVTFSYFIECSICSIILIENCRKTRNTLGDANHPKTERMLRISQIPSPI